MWKLLALSFGAAGAVAVSRKAWAKVNQEKSNDFSPMQIIAKGANSFQEHIGPWAVEDFTFGLAAMGKMTEKEPPPPPGEPVEELSRNVEFLARAQHWRAIAEAVYVFDESSFSLQSQLPESALVHAEWNPHESSLRPAYAVCIDGPRGAVVLSIRGTSHVIDVVVDAGAAPESFCGGKAHGGYKHATEVLLKDVEPHIKRAFEVAQKHEKGRATKTNLVIVGHSMGGAVGIMCGLMLREKYPGLKCWSFSTPASLSHDLAVECASFTTSIVSAHDVVPRFSMASVENLRKRVTNFDWERAKRVLKDDPEWQNLEKAMKAGKGAQEQISKGVEGVKDKVGAGDDDDEKKQKKKSEEKEGKEKQKSSSKPPALYPPGRLLVLCADPPGFGKRPENRSGVPKQRDYGSYVGFEESLKTSWQLREAKQEDFLEIIISPWCTSDHMLGNLCEGIAFLQSRSPPVPA